MSSKRRLGQGMALLLVVAMLAAAGAILWSGAQAAPLRAAANGRTLAEAISAPADDLEPLPPGASIETVLPNMTVPVATAALAGFLDENRRAGRLCLRVVHGKGHRSAEGPVLKRLVDRLLRHRGDVLAFRSARPADGGAGAVIVLLRGK